MLRFSDMPPMDNLPGLRFSYWKYLDTCLVWIYEGSPQSPSGNISSAHYSAWLVRRGQVEVKAQDGIREVQAGSWIILPPGNNWRSFSPRAKILSISFDARWATGQSLFTFKKAQCFPPAMTKEWLAPALPMLRQVRERHPYVYNELQRETLDYSVYAELHGHFQFWLARLWKGVRLLGNEVYLPPFHEGRALEMRRWIDAVPMHQPFRLSELAQAFGLGPAQTNRLFCATFSTTPKRYFTQRRLAFAQSALRASPCTVKEICYASGFRHLPEFSSWFKGWTGKSPSVFRKNEESE